MSSTCRHRDDCRLCGSRELVRVLELAPTPPANAFVPEAKLAEPQEAYPLDVWFCGNCKHIQLLDVVDPTVLFGDYPYVSGTSPVFVRHFEDYAAEIVSRFSLDSGDLVVDIGSNDGTLLRPFQAAGMTVLGIDPAQAIPASASANGIETLPDFFTRETAARIGERHGKAMCITANNVFAHIDDLAGTADAVRGLLAPQGVFVFEVSYLSTYSKKPCLTRSITNTSTTTQSVPYPASSPPMGSTYSRSSELTAMAVRCVGLFNSTAASADTSASRR